MSRRRERERERLDIDILIRRRTVGALAGFIRISLGRSDFFLFAHKGYCSNARAKKENQRLLAIDTNGD